MVSVKKQNRFGQSLFELLVAVSVIGIALLALANLVGNAISANTYAKNRTLAISYTQEALEWLRGERDKSWPQFLAQSSLNPGRLWCINELNWGSSGSCGGSTIDGSIFTRTVTLTRHDLLRIEVTVVTTWTDGSGTHDTRTVMVYSDWKTH